MEIDKKTRKAVIEPVDADVLDLKTLFKEANKYKHKLSPKHLEKLEEDLYE